MLLLLSCTLLIFVGISYQPNVQARGIEEIPGSSHDVTYQIDGIGQRVLRPDIPRSAGPSPQTAGELINLTRSTYLDPLPARPDISQILQNVSVEQKHVVSHPPRFDMRQLNVRYPEVRDCRPVIRGTKRLYSGIACGSEPCSIQTQITVQENYESSEGYRVESTVSAGLQIKGFSVSASTTRERNWQKTWGSGSSHSVTYTWNLPARGHCTPSMAHVELECNALFRTAYYDSRYTFVPGVLQLEWQHNRKTGRYENGQWCRTWRVETAPLSRLHDWTPILDDNGFRGQVWNLPAPEMNSYTLRPRPGILSYGDLVVGKVRGHGGDWQEIFGCEPDWRHTVLEKVTVPLSSEAGALEGYVGCVTGPSSSEDAGNDATGGEL